MSDQNQVGRFQIVSGSKYAYLVDTVTGQSWYTVESGNETDERKRFFLRPLLRKTDPAEAKRLDLWQKTGQEGEQL